MEVETVAISSLRPHPENYREHPPDQLAHIAQSVADHGFYRNVVTARDGTILAGHGVVEAAKKMGRRKIPIVRMPLDPDDPQALKLLAADNEISRLALSDDRKLTDLLRRVETGSPVGLVGTGFDHAMLANLLLVSRPASEIPDVNHAAEWVGMPAFTPVEKPLKVVVSFRNEEDRQAFMQLVDVQTIYKRTKGTWSFWWPNREYDQPAAQEYKAT